MHSTGTRPLSRLVLAGGLIVSLCAVVAGFAILRRYEARPGPRAFVPRESPAAAAAYLDASTPTLLLFLHPQCPCSRATMSELDRIAALCVGKLRILVLFLSYSELGEAGLRSQLWTVASTIPGVEVRIDDGGALAHALGVETSGHALLYAPNGCLLFEGGITSARGHEGDSTGKTSILETVLNGTPTCASTPVFGCLLHNGNVDSTERITP